MVDGGGCCARWRGLPVRVLRGRDTVRAHACRSTAVAEAGVGDWTDCTDCTDSTDCMFGRVVRGCGQGRSVVMQGRSVRVPGLVGTP